VPSPEAPVEGGCLCGGVRYRITGPFRRAGQCHCSRCRKHSGSAASFQGRVARGDFELLSGDELLRTWRPPGGGAAKVFCSVCGSSLFGGTWPDGAEVSVRLGGLDADPGIRPQCHTFTGSRAPWYEIRDGLPQHEEGLPEELRTDRGEDCHE
jgi:hypothetical protein